MNRKAAAATASVVFAVIGFIMACIIWGIAVLAYISVAGLAILAIAVIIGAVVGIYQAFCRQFPT